jgi:LuxR family maltose regulon positive regulatory protein
MERRAPTVTTTPASLEPQAGLLLKTMAPRVQRDLLARPRLMLGTGRFRDVPAVLVQAPGGYGKTSLLAQWRRESLGTGAVVLWLTTGPADPPGRLLRSLVLGFRDAALRPSFGEALLAAPPDPIEGLTEWLAEVARSGLETVLMLDEAERLPADSFEALAYLLRNLPPNLRVLVAMRGTAPTSLDDLVAYGQCATVAAAELRFDVDETIALVRQRFGADFDAGVAVRLHEMADGWPLGLQLALAVAAADRDPQAAAEALLRQSGSLQHRLVGMLLAHLDPADLAFLVRLSVLEDLTPALAAAVGAERDAAARLRRIAATTPVVIAGEQGDWLRLHALAREALRERFAALPDEERVAVHTRAAEWLAANGMGAAAAQQALAAGRRDWACELAERSLYDTLMARGRLDDVQYWFNLIPEAETAARPRLLLAAAWSFAISERHEEAERLVARVLALGGIDDELRCECALVRGAAAVFADDPDRFAALHDPWAATPPLTDPWLLKIHANRSAFRALIDGEPAMARLRQQQAPAGSGEAAPVYLTRWSEFIIGLSYLWEGQVLLAERILRPALLQSDADLGRRNPMSCMLAALLAAALWVRGQPHEAELALANRLDVLERSGMPEAVLLAFRTLSRIAAERSEARSLDLLEGLYAVGEQRAMPRLMVVSLGEQILLHARRYRAETCRGLLARIDALLAAEGERGPLWWDGVTVYRDMAEGYAAVAARDWKAARAPFERANDEARAGKRQRLFIETLGFRALVLHLGGEDGSGLAQEAVELARVYGLTRAFEAAHPLLGERIERIAARAGDTGPAPRAPAPTAPVAPAMNADLVARSSALTPKEREVVELLARNLSNKEIGLTMNIHEDTVKWHVKNLFAKLSAGTRKQVVSRARLMGILAPA